MTAPQFAAPSNGGRRLARRRFDVQRDGLALTVAFLVLLALNLAFWLILLRPAQRRVSALQQSQVTAQATEKRATAVLEQLQAVHRRVRAVQEGIAHFYREMLATKEARLVPFQSALVNVGRDFNVLPQKVSVKHDEREQEGIEEIGFSFPLLGGYENLRQFLVRLEQLDQFLVVRQIALTGAKEGGRMLQLNVEVATYFDAPEVRLLRAAERAAAAGRGARRSRGGR